MKYTFVIPGNPIPLKRPRFGRGNVYDSQKGQKLVYGLLLKNQLKGPLLLGSLHVAFKFFMPIPKKPRKYQKHGMPHIGAPDLSNLIKMAEDCANGILYKDDCQISSISAIKLYDNNPRTEIVISKLKVKQG